MKSRPLQIITLILFVNLLILVSSQRTRQTSAFAKSIGTTTRVSVSSNGEQLYSQSVFQAVSANGNYVAFLSGGAVTDNCANGSFPIFVRNVATGQVECVSISTSGGPPNNGSNGYISLSGDGRYVAFDSSASNLVDNDTNGSMDVFARDRQIGETTRVSVDSNGVQANGTSGGASISSDGRYVAFWSAADNLVTSDSNDYFDDFVHDLQTGQTIRVSVDSNGAQGNGNSGTPSISADGRYVAFDSSASNLIVSDTNGNSDIFLRDLQTGQTIRISVDSNGIQANGKSSFPAISENGRFVAFVSDADNLVSGDTNSVADVFVRDMQTGQTSRVSVDSSGVQANGTSFNASGYPWIISISGDGRYVVFASNASNLVSDDTNGYADVFLHDRQTGQTSRVSVSSNGTQGNGASYAWSNSVSNDGRFIAFYSSANNLVSGDSNDNFDVFVRDREGIPIDAIVAEARKDVGMPYDTYRGCQSPYIGCNGPYHGFYKGVCTDLVLDAYNAAISFDFHNAILQDHLANPAHYYRHNGLARNADDMWHYFGYTGQLLSNTQPYQPGDIAFFNWDGGEIDHVNIISQVDANGKPQYVVDAGRANAAEYPWTYYAPFVSGHGRLGNSEGLGAQHLSSTQPFQVLRITVDSPSVSLALQDSDGKFTSSNLNENLVASNVEAFIPYAPAGEYADLGTSKVISVTYPLSNTSQYRVQVTGDASTQYNLTIQTLQDGNVTASQTFPKSITSGQTQGTNLQVSAPNGTITFTASDPVQQPNLAINPSEIAVEGQTGLPSQAIFAVNETSGQQSASNVSLSVSNLTDQFGNTVAGTLFTSTPSSFSLAAGGSQNVQLSINLANIPTGTYLGRVLITASNGSPQSVPLTLVVEAAPSTATPTNTRTATPTLTRTATSTPTQTPTLACTTKPDKPIPAKPKNGGTVKKLKVKLTWNIVPCTNTYTVIVREGSKKGPKVQTQKNLTVSQFKTKTLTSGKTYFWKVKATNSNGSTGSVWRSFNVK